MYVTYDSEADAAYVQFAPGEKSAGAERLDEQRHVHFDASGNPIAVEFLFVARGINLEGVPRADEIRDALRGFRALAVA